MCRRLQLDWEESGPLTEQRIILGVPEPLVNGHTTHLTLPPTLCMDQYLSHPLINNTEGGIYAD